MQEEDLVPSFYAVFGVCSYYTVYFHNMKYPICIHTLKNRVVTSVRDFKLKGNTMKNIKIKSITFEVKHYKYFAYSKHHTLNTDYDVPFMEKNGLFVTPPIDCMIDTITVYLGKTPISFCVRLLVPGLQVKNTMIRTTGKTVIEYQNVMFDTVPITTPVVKGLYNVGMAGLKFLSLEVEVDGVSKLVPIKTMSELDSSYLGRKSFLLEYFLIDKDGFRQSFIHRTKTNIVNTSSTDISHRLTKQTGELEYDNDEFFYEVSAMLPSIQNNDVIKPLTWAPLKMMTKYKDAFVESPFVFQPGDCYIHDDGKWKKVDMDYIVDSDRFNFKEYPDIYIPVTTLK